MSRTSVVEAQSDTPPARPDARLSPRAKEAIAGFVFMSPWVVGFLGLTLGPMLASLWLSFTKYNLLSAPKWIGVQNYVSLFADARFLHSIRVTLLYVGVSVPLKLGFALLLAVLLNRGLRGLTVYRALFYVPSLLGSSVAIAILWRQIFGDDGIVNAALRGLGIHHPPSWLTDPSTAIYTLIALAVWEFGSPMIIFLAGLRQIPHDLYEAAQIDGAGRVRQFTQVTIPLLTPLILFNLVLQMIGAFQAFTPAYIISGGTGGPVDGTLFYTLYLYQQAFGYLQMGYGAAMAWLLFVVVALCTGAIFLTSRYWVFYMEQSS